MIFLIQKLLELNKFWMKEFGCKVYDKNHFFCGIFLSYNPYNETIGSPAGDIFLFLPHVPASQIVESTMRQWP